MNTILYIPTGSGKTYITTMLIKAKGESLTKYVYEYYVIVLKYNKTFILTLFKQFSDHWEKGENGHFSLFIMSFLLMNKLVI